MGSPNLTRTSRGDHGRKSLTTTTQSMRPPEHPIRRLQRAIGNRAMGRFIQAKLRVSQSGDTYEQEADRVAEEVIRTPEAGLTISSNAAAASVQRKCADCAGGESACPQCLAESPAAQRQSPTATDAQLIQPQFDLGEEMEEGRPMSMEEDEDSAVQRSADGNIYASSDITRRIVSAKGMGSPLSESVRQELGSKMGADFSGVRIHTGGDAIQLNRDLAAHAFTHGKDIYFNAGKYRPETVEGRRLLAHELTHVIQQGGDSGAGVVQRAEVDDRSCAGLTDIESDIDTQVNSEISAARTAAGSPIAVPAFLRDVENRLGGGAVSPIEKFIEALPATKRKLPSNSLAGTKYAGVDAVNRFYRLQTLGLAHVVGSSAKIHNICVGADKLGHFFEEGFIYFQIVSIPGMKTDDAKSAGRALEIGIQGLGATGVYSNADQAANLAGLQFYKDLEANPSGFRFSVKNYITDKWNEQSNPSFYSSNEGSVIWSNLLTGTWDGSFTSGGGSGAPINAKVDLSATAAGAVTGANEWPAGAATPNKEKIKNGVITQQTTAVSGTFPGDPSVSDTPVSGVSIEFDWEATSASGKGKWKSVDEQTLEGTWGIGSSRTNGGVWKLKKRP